MLRKLTVRDQALAMRGGMWQECARRRVRRPERVDYAVRALTRQNTAHLSAQVRSLCGGQSTRRSDGCDPDRETDKTAVAARTGWVLFQDLVEVTRLGGDPAR